MTYLTVAVHELQKVVFLKSFNVGACFSGSSLAICLIILVFNVCTHRLAVFLSDFHSNFSSEDSKGPDMYKRYDNRMLMINYVGEVIVQLVFG